MCVFDCRYMSLVGAGAQVGPHRHIGIPHVNLPTYIFDISQHAPPSDTHICQHAHLFVHGFGQVLLVPSAFTVVTGAAHWEVLLRARAIESQCYVLASAQVGL